jgi:oxaloacetate decarboxylase alpha subunit
MYARSASGGAVGRRYTPQAAPLKALLKALAERPAARDLVIERGGIRIALHAGASLS